MKNPLKNLKDMWPKPAVVPPSSIREPHTFSPDDLKLIKNIGVSQNELRQSLTFSTQINFERTNIYKEVDRAVLHWMVGASVELYADFATNYSTLQDASVWITSDSQKYTNNLMTFLESIGIEEKIFDWGWTAAAYGDLFIGVEGAPGLGVVNIDDSQHPANVSRVDYKGALIGFYLTPFEAGALEVTAGDAKLLPPWSWVHVRVLGAKKKRPMYCLEGSTQISLLNGTNPTIKEMAKDVDKYIGKAVLSVNPKTTELEVDYISGVQKTRLDAQLIRVHLDNDLFVDCTPDHKFMLRDGSYKEAQYLKVDESLMPFYEKVNSKKSEMPGYILVYNPATKGYVYAHRLTFSPKSKAGYPIHHCDFDKENNDPENLKRMSCREHVILHASYIDALQEGMERRRKEPGFREWMLNNLEQARRHKHKKHKKHAEENCPCTVCLSKRGSRPKHDVRVCSCCVCKGARGELLGVAKLEAHKQHMRKPKSEAHKQNMRKPKSAEARENMRLAQIKRATERKDILQQANNHKVVRVEWLKKRKDTYDLTTRKNHNFPLSAGVFVHNSDPSFSEYRTVHLMGPETRQVTSKYGTSMLINSLPIYKRLRLAEDSILLARLTRGILKYVYKIRVDGNNVEASASIIEEYMTILKHARALNTDPNNPNYDSKCLRGDTSLRLCNGEEVTIRDLVDNKEEYIGRHIWSVNPDTLQLEPTRILEAQQTRKDAQLIRVHLDNDKHIDCTPDHKFMLRDGSYKEAQYLKVNESLMPFYSKINTTDVEGMSGYELIYDPGKKKYVFAHRVTFNPKSKAGYPIHHKDFNRENNDSDNLKRIPTKEHRALYVAACDSNRIVKAYRTKFCACGCGGQLKEDSRYPKKFIHAHNRKNIQLTREHKSKIGVGNSKPKPYNLGDNNPAKRPEVRKKISDANRGRIVSIETRLKQSKSAIERCKRQAVMNHKVVKIEWLNEREDTYDITVEKNHNFSLSNGIFVHNSNPMASVEDLFIPVWGDINDISIEEIGGKTDIRWIVDIEELRNQLASALRCPLVLLGGFVQEASGSLGAEAISQLDIRFARSSRRLQRALIEGITRLCQIHLAYQNMDPDPRLFEVHMSETSTEEEKQIKESLDTSVDVITRFVEMLDAVTEGTAQQFDKIEIIDYFNKKLLKLGDLDLKSFLKEAEVDLADMEGQGVEGAGGAPAAPYVPPAGEEDITGEPGEEEMTIPPMESRAAVLREAVKFVKREQAKATRGTGKITRNLDYIAPLPLPENTQVKNYEPGKVWEDAHVDVKVKIGKTINEKSKSSTNNKSGKKGKASKKG